MTTQPGSRSQKRKGYYERQFAKTAANKARRAAKRAAKRAAWRGRRKASAAVIGGAK